MSNSTGDADEPETDPTRIRSVAVHREDVAKALEATLRTDRRVVLRVTPPYSGRMRARIHSVDESPKGGGRAPDGPIHIDAADLVEASPQYPEADETAAELPDADVAARRERHAEAVAEWRATIRESVGGTVEIPVDVDGGSETETHDIGVVALG